MTTIINTSSCTVTLHDVAISAATGIGVYSEGFESGVGGWTVNFGTAVTQSATVAHSGTKSLRYEANNPGDGIMHNAVYRSATGLTVGREYVYSAWLRVPAAQQPLIYFALGVDGLTLFETSRFSLAAAPDTWEKRTIKFVATATTHQIEFRVIDFGTGAGRYLYVDDVALVEGRFFGDLDVTPTAVRITLDERAAPYVDAQVTIPAVADYTLSSIDPREDVRLTIEAHNEWVSPAALPDQDRTFNLLLTGRRFSATGASIVITANSDEAKLTLTGNATDYNDTAVYVTTLGYMLRTAVNTVIARAGGVLEAGSANADITVTSDVTNLILNPSAEVDATNWSAGTGVTNIARSTTVGGFAGSAAVRATMAAGTGNFRAVSASYLPVSPNTPYTASVYIRSSVARSGTLNLRFYDAATTQLTTATSAAATTSTSGWTRYTVSSPSDATAAFANVFFETTSNTVGQFHYADAAMLTATAAAVVYFDGSTTADTYYTYAWRGTAGASQSTRTRRDTRDADSLVWKPGVKAWDFISPIVNAAGLRLFCDEQRKWYLVDPETYTVAGTVTVADGESLIDATDDINLDDGEWADAVVQPYEWIDSNGESQIVYDVAGDGTVRLLTMEPVNHAYPGPGAAAAILARAQQRGRAQDLEALTDLDATPGMAISTTIPNVVEQAGVVSSVTWTWGGTGSDEMRVSTRGLVDA